VIDNKLLNQIYPNRSKTFSESLQEIPTLVRPIVTTADYDSKFLVRYFVRSVNDDSHVVEVDKKQFDNLKNNPRFITTSVRWKIVGKKESQQIPSGAIVYGVLDTNRQTVANTDLTFGGLRKYIVDYGEFWISEI